MSQRVRAIRGATTVTADDAQMIVGATREMLDDIIARNGLALADMVSIIFTATADLVSEFPAVAARGMGLVNVPLLCAREISVEGSLPLCIRVMLHAYMPSHQLAVHVYLHEAVRLRDDLADGESAPGEMQ